jgi:hypothetical protein
MSLVQVATNTVTSAVSSVEFVSKITTDDVYLLTMNNVRSSSDAQYFARAMSSSSVDSSSNYDYAHKYLKSDTSFSNVSGTNFNGGFVLTTTQESNLGNCNVLAYLYNFQNGSEYSFCSSEEAHLQHTPNNVRGIQGGTVLTVASAYDGLHIYGSAGNITQGTFTLYKVV